MSGALLQLAALGSQDAYLTGNPEITLFKKKYHRYTHFASETIQVSFDGGSIDFGSSNAATSTLEQSGDLISKMVLVLKIDAVTDSSVDWGYVNRLGHAIIDEISVSIGQTEIDTHFGDWINIYHDIYSNKSHETNYNKLIGNTSELKKLQKSHTSLELFIPLYFWFCKSTSSAFPICAITKQNFQIKVRLNEAISCINYKGSVEPTSLPTISSGYLLVDYIFLDNQERTLFMTQDHEYLIEQVQDMTDSVTSVNPRYNLIFDKPCKYLSWYINLKRYYQRTPFLSWATDDDWELAKTNFSKLIWLATRKDLDVSDTTNPVIKINSTFTNIGESIDLVTGGLSKLEELQAKVKAIFLFASVNTNNSNEYLAKATIDNVVLLESSITYEDMSLTIDELKENATSSTVHTTQSTFLDLNTISIIDAFNSGNNINRTDNPIISANLQLNGKDRFQERDAFYFNYLNPYYYFTNKPQDGINLYSFSLAPTEIQPSGTINFGQINTKELLIKLGQNNTIPSDTYFSKFFQEGRIRIFVYNYTLLKVSPKRNLVGLAY